MVLRECKAKIDGNATGCVEIQSILEVYSVQAIVVVPDQFDLILGSLNKGYVLLKSCYSHIFGGTRCHYPKSKGSMDFYSEHLLTGQVSVEKLLLTLCLSILNL